MQLNDFAEEDIDSCDTGLITSDGEEINEGTVGDALCERMFNFTYPTEAERKVWYAKRWSTGAGVCRKDSKACIERKEKEGVIIGAYHSYCGRSCPGTLPCRHTWHRLQPHCPHHHLTPRLLNHCARPATTKPEPALAQPARCTAC